MAHSRQLLAPVCALTLAVFSIAAAPITVSVEADDALPGFRHGETISWLAERMGAAGLGDWRFTPAFNPDIPPRDRIEWHVEYDPYAGGNVRQFIPMPGVQRMFGAHHLISVKVMLYLDGQYQTLVYGEALVQGGAQDKDLTDLVDKMTHNLLGETGAYRAIDMTPAKRP
jgi:hypothetical protein